jgi:hypothetical protein
MGLPEASGYRASPQHHESPHPAPVFDYPQPLPRPYPMNPHSYEALPLRDYGTPSPRLLSLEGYSSRPASRGIPDALPDRDPRSYPTSSASQLQRRPYSPSNIKDLHLHYPQLAQDFHDRELSPRRLGANNVRLSLRDMEGAWEDRYEPVGHGSYVQSPNGNHARDAHPRYSKRN